MQSHSESCCSSCGVSKPGPAIEQSGRLILESGTSGGCGDTVPKPLYVLNSAWQEPAGSDPEGRLVSKRKFVDGDGSRKQRRGGKALKRQLKRRDKVLREKCADQRKARQIYFYMTPDGEVRAGRGVTFCGWTQIPNQETKLMRDEGEQRAYYTGLQTCGLRWVCPICTAKKSEESREQMNRALAIGRKRGLNPVMLTLTVRHDIEMSLSDLWDRISTAEQELKNTRAWKHLNTNYLEGGFAKGVEATHSDINGWHPHTHTVLMVRITPEDGDSELSPEELSEVMEARAIEKVESLREEWLHQLDRVGLDGTSDAAREHSFHIQGAKAAGNYVTKWGAAEELTLSASKAAKSKKGRTPWQLLRAARTAPTEKERQRAAALWWEFIQTFKGVHQLRQSPKFRELVKAYVEPPTLAEPENHLEIYNFGYRDSSDEWELVRSKRLLMIEAAQEGDPTQAAAAVVTVIACAATDTDLFTQDEPDFDVIDDAPDLGRGQGP